MARVFRGCPRAPVPSRSVPALFGFVGSVVYFMMESVQCGAWLLQASHQRVQMPFQGAPGREMTDLRMVDLRLLPKALDPARV